MLTRKWQSWKVKKIHWVNSWKSCRMLQLFQTIRPKFQRKWGHKTQKRYPQLYAHCSIFRLYLTLPFFFRERERAFVCMCLPFLPASTMSHKNDICWVHIIAGESSEVTLCTKLSFKCFCSFFIFLYCCHPLLYNSIFCPIKDWILISTATILFKKKGKEAWKTFSSCIFTRCPTFVFLWFCRWTSCQ